MHLRRYRKTAVSRPFTSHSVNLRELFLHVQQQMLAGLGAAGALDHPTAVGSFAEQHWLSLFNTYLPQRYRAGSAFIVDAAGRRSRQIDIAIYDRFYSPILFHVADQPHIPAESVYAIFEVKQTLSSKWIADAASKISSVRALSRTSARIPVNTTTSRGKRPPPILAGILSLETVWATGFDQRLPSLLNRLQPNQMPDLGCILRHGSFELTANGPVFTPPEHALIHFFLTLLGRLQSMGAPPAIDYSVYRKVLTP